jgi:hypothetical protein
MCRLHITQINKLAEMEKKLGRALDNSELRKEFGHVNSKGQYILPDGSLWDGVRRAV